MEPSAEKHEIFETGDKVEFDESQIKDQILKSTKDKCSVCKFGDLKPHGKPTPLIVYTREGGAISEQDQETKRLTVEQGTVMDFIHTKG